MGKIEAVRPGGVFQTSLADTPLAELLMGILRGNLTGTLSAELGAPAPNRVHFKDGVPVTVELPALGVSLSSILMARGELTPEQASHVTSRARTSGDSESRVVEIERIVAEGALRDGVRARARAQLEQLFRAGPVSVSFHEGTRIPEGAELVVLQPLPIIFAGLCSAGGRAQVDAFLSRYEGHRFRLTETYPREVDPFEWGPQLEERVLALEAPDGLAGLTEGGIARPIAGAALLALRLADMLEIQEPARRSGPPPRSPSSAGVDAPVAHGDVRALVAGRLEPLYDQTYFQLLRVPPGASPAEVARAHAAVVRRHEGSRELAVRALLALYDEAKAVLADPQAAAAYRAALEDDSPRGRQLRRRMEGEPKILRAIDALTSGRAGEAEAWIEWARRLEPERAELRIFKEAVAVAASPRKELAATLLGSMLAAARGLDPGERAWGAIACVEALRGDSASALKRLERLGPAGSEPWRRWLARLSPSGR